MRKTKVICTIGPATESESTLRALIHGGMNLARLNFSHGTHAQHARVIRRLRRLSREMGAPIGIIQDLRGPKLRVGKIADPPMILKRGDRVVLSGTVKQSRDGVIPVGPVEALQLMSAKNKVLLDDGKTELRVERVHRQRVECKVLRGGELLSGKGVNLPTVRTNFPALTKKDIADLAFGLKQGVDWVAMSFVRCAADIELLRARMEKAQRTIPIIAKIEKPQAIDHLDEIISAADGVMVARGDLGVEMPLEQVPLLQKKIIEECALAGKPAIVATQMLESMLHAARPTRAEVSDIANAIFDGADALMLSGETAIGDFPLKALQVMDKVARQTEKRLDYPLLLAERTAFPCRTVTDAISQACGQIADDLKAAAIITSTSSGHTAAMVSRLRPEAPLLAITSDEGTLRRLTLWWGVEPVLTDKTKNTEEMTKIALKVAQKSGVVRSGDHVVITAGVPAGVPGHTNLIKVETLG
ncbi:MAG: pyruvate kinase [Armatimonadetes bacterium]|nr:pyruvate kinase [Armatimonadota bacterium]NIM22861.1 pyruvate kinase [Armatimonadota bacterium]NIM66727.1 pyruvate kinase [Armatimonadota bacterium]NIM75284.1 pyruvate kinase [Armatimonadota bacterium]NIN04924.1 pyruvate kinase [Armatimonadota bacterium]